MFVRDSLYVDDLVSGADDNEKACKLYGESKEMLSKDGFNLRKWHSNSEELMKSIDPAQRNASLSTINEGVNEDDLSFPKSSIACECEVQDGTQVKILGSIWGTGTDTLLFNFEDVIIVRQIIAQNQTSPIEVVGENIRPFRCFVSIYHQIENVFPAIVTCKNELG